MKPHRYPLLLMATMSALPTHPALARDDDGASERAEKSAATASRHGGPTTAPGTVRLTPEQRRTSGLAVETLRAVAFQPETAAYGKVLDIQPLLELRVRYLAARSATEVATAALDLAGKNRERLSTLHKEEIIAGRELIHAQAQWQADRGREGAARRLMDEIRREARQAWGAELARLALDGDAALFDDLLSHRRALLLVSLPRGYAMPAGGTPLFVAREPDRARAVRAEPISPATKTDELVQGETWFYHAADPGLRSGMRVNAWAPRAGGKLDGVAIPLSAVVWHAGKPWVYRQTGDDTFARAEIADYRDYAGGWFVTRGFAPGERVVVTGGQMLLSEEYRGGIPDEDDD